MFKWRCLITITLFKFPGTLVCSIAYYEKIINYHRFTLFPQYEDFHEQTLELLILTKYVDPRNFEDDAVCLCIKYSWMILTVFFSIQELWSHNRSGQMTKKAVNVYFHQKECLSFRRTWNNPKRHNWWHIIHLAKYFLSKSYIDIPS